MEQQTPATDPASRRRFLEVLGGAGAAGAVAVLLAACGDDDSDSSGAATSSSGQGQAASGMKRDLEILNYALTLEYLEADFYAQVVESGLVKDAKVASLAKRIGEAEQEHVDALKATVQRLGGKPAAKPRTKFEPVLEGGVTMVLQTAATVENLGAAAYLGQAARITSPEILQAALAIHSVEARHAAALNELVGRGFTGDGALEGSIPDGAFAKAMSMADVLAAVKPYLAS